MKRSKVKELLKKYEDGSISSKEEKLLEDFLDSFQKGHSWSAWKHSDGMFYDQDQFERLKKACNSTKTKSKKHFSLQHLKYAAVFIGIIGLSISFYLHNASGSKTGKSINDIVLTLDNGDSEILPEHTIFDITKQNPSVKDKKENIQKVVYNTVKVPKGKKFRLILSDGTKVYLNASSSLRFPDDFANTSERKVFLSGEAYFDVTKNTQKAFLVTSSTLNTKVFGTRFNVSTYPDDIQSSVALIEGKVGVQSSDTNSDLSPPRILHPDEAAIYNQNTKELIVKPLLAITSIAWVNDFLYFKNESFEQISKKLERRFNIEIINKYSPLSQENFTGNFDTRKGIDHILKVFSYNFPFEYETRNNRIILTPKLTKT